MKTKKRRENGFTLLEVMIAITIMTVAFAAILTSQSGSIRQTIKTKDLTVAGWLARNVMADSELHYEGKPFSEIPKEKSEQFSAPFQEYKWKREVREIKFPELPLFNKKSGETTEPLNLLVKTLTKFLNNSVREMAVTVSWNKPEGEQQITITTYLVDLTVEFDFSI